MNVTLVFLYLTVGMPREVPDVHFRVPERTVDECLADAKAFLTSDARAKFPESLGLSAACITQGPADNPT